VRGVCLSCRFYVFFSFFRGGALLLRNPPRPATLKPELRHSYAMCGVSSVVATHFSPMLRMLSSLFRSQKHTVCFSPCMCVSLFFFSWHRNCAQHYCCCCCCRWHVRFGMDLAQTHCLGEPLSPFGSIFFSFFFLDGSVRQQQHFRSFPLLSSS